MTFMMRIPVTRMVTSAAKTVPWLTCPIYMNTYLRTLENYECTLFVSRESEFDTSRRWGMHTYIG